MSDLTFRNIDAAPTDRVETWPYEGLVAAIERGSLSDWRRIIAAVRRAPWGPAARRIEKYATYGEEKPSSPCCSPPYTGPAIGPRPTSGPTSPAGSGQRSR
jgi:hypothetical protein